MDSTKYLYCFASVTKSHWQRWIQPTKQKIESIATASKWNWILYRKKSSGSKCTLTNSHPHCVYNIGKDRSLLYDSRLFNYLFLSFLAFSLPLFLTHIHTLHSSETHLRILQPLSDCSLVSLVSYKWQNINLNWIFSFRASTLYEAGNFNERMNWRKN